MWKNEEVTTEVILFEYSRRHLLGSEGLSRPLRLSDSVPFPITLFGKRANATLPQTEILL